MWYEKKDDRVIFKVQARPASSRNAIVGVVDDALKIKIKAPPVDGAANKELIKFLSKTFKVPKSSVTLVSGMSGKNKRVALPLCESLELWLRQNPEAQGESD